MAKAVSTLGDLVRGLALLRPGDDATALRIATMLTQSNEPVVRHAIPSGSEIVLPSGSPVGTPAPTRDSPPPKPLSGNPAAYRLRLRRILQDPPVPAWLNNVEAMPAADQDAPRASVPPLLHPSCQRALLLELCATRSGGDDIDLDTLTAQLAAGLALERIPFRQRNTLQEGLVVLLDHRLGMAPYRSDQLGMVRLARSLIPDEWVRVGRFKGVPGRRTLFDNVRWVSNAPQAETGGPVLILSDLSVGGPFDDEDRAAVFEWTAYFSLVTSERRQLRVLVPRAAARWPAGYQRHPALVEWSRALKLADIRRHAAHPR